MKKRMLAMLLVSGMLFTNYSFVQAEGQTETTTQGGNLLEEVDFSNLVSLNAPESDDVYRLVSDVNVESTETEDGDSLITVENTGEEDIENWTIAYEADYQVLGATNASVVSAEDVIELSADSEDETIAAGEQKDILLTIDGQYQDTDNARVYALATDDTDAQVVDSISYDPSSDSVEFDITDVPADIRSSGKALDDIRASLGRGDIPDASVDAIIGSDGRSKVSNVTDKPYDRIACIIITLKDGSMAQGTAYMISSDYMLTAGHCVYDVDTRSAVKSITAYFGVNGSSYTKKIEAASWAWCASYPSNPSIDNDWGAIKLSSSPNTSYFSVGYANDRTLKSTSLTVCGYPGDKTSRNNQSPIEGENRYMYKMSGKPSRVSTNALYYSIDTYGGQSGAPIYSSDTVYGIHTRGMWRENGGRRFTSSLVNAFKEKGWCK